MTDDDPELEAAARALWAEYRAARDAAGAHDYEALARRVRALRASARRRGRAVVEQQLQDLGTYVKRAREEQQTPEDRLRARWPALVQGELAAALATAEAALASGSAGGLRRAAAGLRCTAGEEPLAEIAEEGLAEEFAELIPGAAADAGVLVLSTEHAALVERGRQVLARIDAALRARR